jgi:hypothetical protein
MLHQGSNITQFESKSCDLSDLATSCEEKIQSQGEFLAEFVDDEDGELYAEHIANRSEPESSNEQALTVLPWFR